MSAEKKNKSDITKEQLKKLIDVAAGRIKADLVIKNARIVDVFSGTIDEGEVAVSDKWIAGISLYGDETDSPYEGETVVDAGGKYLMPGFIDGHIHVESTHLSPEEAGRMIVIHGVTTLIADPHEIVNVCGIRGLDYMMGASKGTALDIRFMLPSCVPATPYEHSGAVIDAAAMEEPILRDKVLGLGEFMDFVGVAAGNDAILDKLMVAKEAGKIIDGHVPALTGKDLTAYAAAGIHDDHECSTVEEMERRLRRGLYILIREGSACHDLRALVKGITPENSRRCVLCSDDRQPKTMIEKGHIDNHLQMCIEEGLDPITAIRMATLNAAECFRLYDKGAVAPSYLADLVLVDDLKDFHVDKVWIAGTLAADGGEYILPIEKYSIDTVKGSVRVKDFSKEKFKMNLKSDRVHVMRLIPGTILTADDIEKIKVSADGEWVYDPDQGISKIAVVERHNLTGYVGKAFLKGYGIKAGAVAVTDAHDSHNIIVTGVSDEEMETAVNAIVEQEGGIVLVKDGEVIASMPMPIAGLMSDKDCEYVNGQLNIIHEKAHDILGISHEFDPITTLAFMALPVIPEVKVTDMGLFDVRIFDFIPIEAE